MAGRKASEASCVSASKTPTAETDSEGLEPRRGERSERSGSSANEVSKRSRRARQSGSARRDDADTHGLASGGSGPKRVGEQVGKQVKSSTDCDRVRIVLSRSCSRIHLYSSFEAISETAWANSSASSGNTLMLLHSNPLEKKDLS